ncbi:MAG TPA: hypothetical protein PK299_05670 [Anaerolineales bacterium]|nr:hypothetical protein [Anaerolineales bacterium]
MRPENQSRSGKPKRIIYASELTSWDFCQRSWWYSVVEKHTSVNQPELQRGESAHRATGKLLAGASWAQFFAIVFGIFALTALILWFLWQ